MDELEFESSSGDDECDIDSSSEEELSPLFQKRKRDDDEDKQTRASLPLSKRHRKDDLRGEECPSSDEDEIPDLPRLPCIREEPYPSDAETILVEDTPNTRPLILTPSAPKQASTFRGRRLPFTTPQSLFARDSLESPDPEPLNEDPHLSGCISCPPISIPSFILISEDDDSDDHDDDLVIVLDSE